ncbi:cytochrome P450 [Embleya sp. NPDC055664]
MHSEDPSRPERRPDPRCPVHHLPDDPGSMDNPYPLLERLRLSGPVTRVRLYRRFNVWWTTTHSAAVAALNAPELGSDQRNVHPDLAPHISPMRVGLIDKDPPDHTRLRAAALRAFSGRTLPEFDRRARELCAEPVAGLLGLPHQTNETLRSQAENLVRPLDGDAVRAGIAEARVTLQRHIRAAARPASGDARRRGPRPQCDVLSDGTAEDWPPATSDEWTDVVLQMYVAGRQSTADFLGTLLLGVLAMDGWAHLCRDPAIRRSAVEEYLRLDGPIVRGVWRFARTDLTLAGTPIAAGDIVIVSLALADRDPAVFRGPTRADWLRSPNRHVQFGLGAHRCIGAPLVHSLGDALLNALAGRFPNARLAESTAAPPRERPRVFRGPDRVPAILDPPHPR